VVAEQQNQMMTVPEVPEPGITAVVQRPATPFDALQAARQDAAYQAAHEQAVQVVNGIAAQYVETRSQLSNISALYGEDFSALEPKSEPARSESAPIARSPSTGFDLAAPPEPQPQARPFALETFPTTHGKSDANTYPTSKAIGKSQYVFAGGEPPIAREPAKGLSPDEHRAQDERLTAGVEFFGPEPATPSWPADGIKNAKTKQASSPTQKEAFAPITPRGEYGSINSPDTRVEYEREAHHAGSIKRTNVSQIEGHYPALSATTSRTPTSMTEDIDPFGPQPAHVPALDNNSNPAMIPPYSGIGSVRRERENRNPRPAYLKERKSVWLPETIAAPADGVITPDWFEQH
jgi:hypothetical protein